MHFSVPWLKDFMNDTENLTVSLVAFHSTKNSGNFKTMANGMTEKFSENPKIFGWFVYFPKCKLSNRKFRKFREEIQMERKFAVRNFRKFG